MIFTMKFLNDRPVMHWRDVARKFKEKIFTIGFAST